MFIHESVLQAQLNELEISAVSIRENNFHFRVVCDDGGDGGKASVHFLLLPPRPSRPGKRSRAEGAFVGKKRANISNGAIGYR